MILYRPTLVSLPLIDTKMFKKYKGTVKFVGSLCFLVLLFGLMFVLTPVANVIAQ